MNRHTQAWIGCMMLLLTAVVANGQLTNAATVTALKGSLQSTPGWDSRLRLVDDALVVEAEDGNFVGRVDRHCCWRFIALNDRPHSTFTGRAFVDIANRAGGFIEFDLVAKSAGPHVFIVRYVHQKTDARPAEVRVNDQVAIPVLNFPSIGVWTVWGTVSNVISLQEGRNVVRLTALNESGLPNLDHFEIAAADGAALIVEAEDCRFEGKLDSHCCWRNISNPKVQHSTFSGRGYVDSTNAIGSVLEVAFDAPAPGDRMLYVRYTHAKAEPRPAELRINDAVANRSLAFPSTSAWTDWRFVSNAIPVKAGRNVIRLTALNESGFVNLDHFEIAEINH